MRNLKRLKIVVTIMIITIIICVGSLYMLETHGRLSLESKIGDFSLISTTPLKEGTKPVILFIGAEACPFCAAESWSLATALSKFGNLSGLSHFYSNGSDSIPNVPGDDFSEASFQSNNLAFWEVETTTSSWNQKLQSLNSTEATLMQQFDKGNGIPFILIDGLYLEIGSRVNPKLISNLTWQQCLNLTNTPGTFHDMVQEEVHNITQVLNYVKNFQGLFLNTSLNHFFMLYDRKTKS